ncbi:MAG: ureidoglycolate lyase [Pseudomonadota bacterium]
MPAELVAKPLSAETFAPFGQVIEDGSGDSDGMNDARFERFDELCDVDTGGAVSVAIARCRSASSLPYDIEFMERHPLGSQAFVPLDGQRFVVVVASAGDAPDVSGLHAFLSNGRQGINYARGTWHMPLIALESGQRFLVIDRGPVADNCDVHALPESVRLRV